MTKGSKAVAKLEAQVQELQAKLLTAHLANEALHKRLRVERHAARLRLDAARIQLDAVIAFQRKEIHKLIGYEDLPSEELKQWADRIPRLHKIL